MKPIFYCCIAFFIFGCKPFCKCIPEEKRVKFNVFDQQTGTNLFFGPSAVFDYEALQIFRINGSDTVFFQPELTVEASDTFLLLKTILDEGQLGFKFPDTTFSSLTITYLETSDKANCCPNTSYYSAFHFNGNNVDMPAEENDYSLRFFK